MGTCRASLFRSYTFSSTLKPRSGILQRPELSGASYGASVFPQSSAKLPLPCPDCPSLPSLTLWPTFRGHRPRLHTPIIAASDQSSAELPLPCPDWPYLPSLALGATFRAHRPPLGALGCCQAAPEWVGQVWGRLIRSPQGVRAGNQTSFHPFRSWR